MTDPGFLRPAWLIYIRVDGIESAARRIAAAGGRVINGPLEVPGRSWIVNGLDPKRAMFALTGSKWFVWTDVDLASVAPAVRLYRHDVGAASTPRKRPSIFVWQMDRSDAVAMGHAAGRGSARPSFATRTWTTAAIRIQPQLRRTLLNCVRFVSRGTLPHQPSSESRPGSPHHLQTT